MSNKATGSGAPLPPVLGSSGGGPSWTINGNGKEKRDLLAT